MAPVQRIVAGQRIHLFVLTIRLDMISKVSYGITLTPMSIVLTPLL